MRNSIVGKVAVFMFATFFFTIILAIAQEALKIDYKYITLPQWGPGIAALILGFAVYKDALSKSISFSGFSLQKLLTCLLLPIAMIGVGFFISRALNLTSGIARIDTQLLYILIPSSFLGAVGEALGWRSYLQFQLDERLGYLLASVLVGLLWGLWHVGHYSNGLIYIASFLIFTISFSIILSSLIRGVNYNLWSAALLHFSANIGFFVLYRENLEDANMMLVNAVVWLTGAVLLLLPSIKGFVSKTIVDR